MTREELDVLLRVAEEDERWAEKPGLNQDALRDIAHKSRARATAAQNELEPTVLGQLPPAPDPARDKVYI